MLLFLLALFNLYIVMTRYVTHTWWWFTWVNLVMAILCGIFFILDFIRGFKD